MEYVSGIIWAILGFGILVFIHELGHFIFARWTGIGVETFSIGFGRAIFQFTHKGVLWKIGWLPFGGFCKMKGQEDFGKPETNGEPDEFYQRPPWARLLTVFGGPLFNIILGVLILSAAYFFLGEQFIKNGKIKVKEKYKHALKLKDGDIIQSVNGQEVKSWNELAGLLQLESIYQKNQALIVQRNNELLPINYYLDENVLIKGELGFTIDVKGKVLIKQVMPNTPAKKAGMLKDDIILSLDGQPITSTEIPANIINKKGIKDDTRHEFLLQRNDKKIKLIIQPETKTINQNKVRQIGIMLAQKVPKEYQFTKKYSLLESFPKGFNKAVELMSLAIMQFKFLARLKADTVRENVSGPVGIITLIGKRGNAGIIPYINIIAVISILLGVMNLLPIPAVDGGHIIITLYEMIRRKRVNFKIVQQIQIIGFFVIISLIILLTINDFYKLIFH